VKTEISRAAKRPDVRRAVTPAGPLPDTNSQLLDLHASAGNRAVVQLLSNVQRQAPTPAQPPPAHTPPTTPADARDWTNSAVERLPAEEKKRFEAIEWGRLDFPRTKLPVKKYKKAEADWWRQQPGVIERGGYFIGAHQKEAQELLTALAESTAGGGERRINQGRTAVLKERAFNLARDDFDAVFVDKLVEFQGGLKLHTDAAAKFKQMKAAAKKDNVPIVASSAYRDRASEEKKADEVDNPMAFGKYSPHAMGLAVDINLHVPDDAFDYEETKTGNFKKVLDMLESPVYKWLSAHAQDHGFYPYSQEPWHWEYNPKDFAKTFFDGHDDLKAKITEADEAEVAERKAKAEEAKKKAEEAKKKRAEAKAKSKSKK
jgi:LAS superfamily LD-carboxypeptidase LdcB